jgi:predicted nucleic acid-binding protein
LIFLDTNVISESLRKDPSRRVLDWLAAHDQELAIPTVTLAEIAFGIAKIRPDERSRLLQEGLDAWRARFADRIFPFTEAAALEYGDIMGEAAGRGATLSVSDGMIAAVAIANRGRLASRNTRDFEHLPLDAIDPWA